MPEYPTTIDVKLDNQTITREYLNNTKLGNYIRSVHYADEALSEFINKLENDISMPSYFGYIYCK